MFSLKKYKDFLSIKNSSKMRKISIAALSVLFFGAVILVGYSITMKSRNNVGRVNILESGSIEDLIFKESESESVVIYKKYMEAKNLFVNSNFDESISILEKLTAGNVPSLYADSIYELLTDSYLSKGDLKNASQTLRKYSSTEFFSNQNDNYKNKIYEDLSKIDSGTNVLEERLKSNEVDGNEET